jgi:hypothetical protein
MKKTIIFTICLLSISFNLQASSQNNKMTQNQNKDLVVESTQEEAYNNMSLEMIEIYERMELKQQKHIEKMKEKDNQKK